MNRELPVHIRRLKDQAQTIEDVANDIKATERPSVDQFETFNRLFRSFWRYYQNVERNISQLSPQHIEDNRALLAEFQQLPERVLMVWSDRDLIGKFISNGTEFYECIQSHKRRLIELFTEGLKEVLAKIRAAPFIGEVEKVKNKLIESIQSGSDNPQSVAADLEKMFEITEQGAARSGLSLVKDLLARCLTYLRREDYEASPEGPVSGSQLLGQEGLAASSLNLPERELEEVRALLRAIISAGMREYSVLSQTEAKLLKQLDKVERQLERCESYLETVKKRSPDPSIGGLLLGGFLVHWAGAAFLVQSFWGGPITAELGLVSFILTLGTIPLTFVLAIFFAAVLDVPFKIFQDFLSSKRRKLQNKAGQLQSSLNSVREDLRKFPLP